MSIESIRQYCLGLAGATEKVQWGSDLVFKIGDKMFAVVALEPGSHFMSFKCSPADFAELIERPGIIPAPYLARAQWVALESEDALPPAELRRFVRQAYDIVFAKLPKKMRATLLSSR